MRHARNIANETRWIGLLRRPVEYAVAIALAILSGYWIVRGGW